MLAVTSVLMLEEERGLTVFVEIGTTHSCIECMTALFGDKRLCVELTSYSQGNGEIGMAYGDSLA